MNLFAITAFYLKMFHLFKKKRVRCISRSRNIALAREST